MAKPRKGKTEGGRAGGGSAQLKPERVQARSFQADQVVLVLRIADFGTPGKDGLLALELLEPTEVHGVLIGPDGASEATGIVIEELRLRVPMPAREGQAKSGRRQRRSGAPTRRVSRAPR